ncbi:MAG: tetratricopeptide repeat protein [Polyangiaceae bacterium]|nr:tetratricopeptide repeat protein [Polyangiaceae bacterium]
MTSNGRSKGDRVVGRRSRRVVSASSFALILGVTGVALSQPAPTAGPPPTAPAGAVTAPPTAAPGASGSAPAPTVPAPSASAPATSPSTTSTAPAGPAPHPTSPPLPPPSADQLAALAELQKEADAYEKAARDYRSTITGIVKHHYEDRKRRILAALDSEISVESKALADAREEAIKKHEEFVAKYSGANAHPENTPDKMFRLAALYEERARDRDDDAAVNAGLAQAIALYKRVIREFPNYRELAAIYYYLGHALKDSSRLSEAQQVWRSLVCRNRYPYPVAVDPKDPSRDTVGKLPQDHDADFWRGWDNRHPEPVDIAAKKAKLAPQKGAKKTKKQEEDDQVYAEPGGVDETNYVSPYPDDCQAIPQKLKLGEDPRYVNEVWWLIGDHHFDEIDPAGGPYNFNRAESAYKHSLKLKKRPVYGVAMYKLAWTYFKQQRYEQSVKQFIELLRYTDEEEKKTGDPGTDFRTEAYTYIAGSLTFLDFKGPGPSDPYVPRSDILDTEQDPRQVELKMRIAIERVQDENLIPQKEKWSVEVYKALMQEFKELNQYRNLVEVAELILKKWPLHRDAPVIQNTIADIYDTLTGQSRAGTAERAENSAKALEARTKLARYVGTTDWTNANKDDPEALQTAERLVRGGLRRAAADHTNAGSALVNQALGIGEKSSRDPIFERALSEYKLAATGWSGYLGQDENSPDAYESRYWLADANHMIVVITVALDKSPSQAEIDEARRTAIAVRDSNEDDKYLQPAAYMVVDIAHQALTDQYNLYKRTNGSQGIELREKLKLINEGTKEETFAKDPVPEQVLSAIAARDEYIRRVPPALDTQGNIATYRFWGGEYYFIYGQFEDAKKRFTPIYEQECGKTPWGYKAWERLTTMANREGNIAESRRLAEAVLPPKGKSCAVSKEDELKEATIARPTIALGYYVDAGAAFEKASKMPDGPERNKAWREAAALYKVALEKAPSRSEAPEAAMNGAYCYKQVGDYDQAIAMYSLFIKEYGSEDVLTKLEKGDPSAKPPKNPDPAKYKERTKYLKQAYDALSAAYVLFFNYRTAAETYETISKTRHFEEADRRIAAKNAVILYANVGDNDKMLQARTTFFSLNPPAEQKANVDFLVASADLKTWDERGLDDGANKQARIRAMNTMEAYYNANKANSAATGYVVQAAYHAYKLRLAGKDSKARDWAKNTMQAFDKFKASSPIIDGRNKALSSLQADMAAEAAYRQVEESVKSEFDYETGHHRYEGVIDKVVKAFDDDVKKANDKYWKQLQTVITTYESRAWSVAARARQGSLYDSCRTGLYNARAPGLKLYTEKEEKLLKLAETSDREDLQEQADAIRQRRREQWREARERKLADADRAMVKFYVEAVVWAKTWKIRNQAVDYAIQKLAFYTDILGDAKLREFSQGILDPDGQKPFEYKDGMFLRSRPGMTPSLQPNGVASPLPVLP